MRAGDRQRIPAAGRASSWAAQLAVLACALLSAAPAVAQQLPVPMPQDTRLVVFRYDANDSYMILTRPGAVTHLALEADETVAALALGDTVQWIVQDKGPHLFVKPIRADLFTSGTLVTNRRTYQLALRSSPEGGTWYQRVSWTYPELLAIAREPAAPRSRPDEDAERRADARAAGRVLPLERLNFAYALRGQAAFRPQQVFDDGRFTYVRLPPALQEMPALFVLGEGGEGELVNYMVRGDVLVVQRVAESFVLRLGRAEVTISRQRPADEGRNAAYPWPDAAVPERGR